MARKKIVFVIVEGPSDDDAIGYFLDKLFDKNTVYVQVMHCDITTQNGVNSKNIHLKCCDVIKNYAANNSFRKTDFQEIIHIVDTDGAYISPVETIYMSKQENIARRSKYHHPDVTFEDIAGMKNT